MVPGSDLSKTDEFKVKNDLKSMRSPKSESFDEEFYEKRSKNLSNGHSSSPKRPPWENDDLPRTTWAVDTREIKYIGQKPLDESGLPFTLRSVRIKKIFYSILNRIFINFYVLLGCR